MVPAVYDVTTANIAAVSAKTRKTYDFRVSGSVMRFDGFLKVYEVSEEKKDEDDESANRLPSLDGVKTLGMTSCCLRITSRSLRRVTTKLRW